MIFGTLRCVTVYLCCETSTFYKEKHSTFGTGGCNVQGGGDLGRSFRGPAKIVHFAIMISTRPISLGIAVVLIALRELFAFFLFGGFPPGRWPSLADDLKI